MSYKKLTNKLYLSLDGLKSIYGILFTLPFIIGFTLFYLYPFIQSIIFSINELEIGMDGYKLNYVGLENFKHLLFVDTQFIPVFLNNIRQLLTDVPLILIFSFFAANLLNQKFKGRLFARIIFFLPVILGAEAVQRLEQGDYMTQMMEQAINQDGGMFNIAQIFEFIALRLPEGFVNYISNALNHISPIINNSAVQILIFLAALQSIPKALYEEAKIEGATGWEIFWKVTFPLISPMILACFIYTIIDFFTSPQNELVQLITNTAWGGAGYGISAAMSWFYFLAIIIVIATFIKIISKHIHYEV